MISWNLLWTLLNQLNRAPKPHDSFGFFFLFQMKSAIATPPRTSRSLQSVMQKIKLRWKQERFWKLLCCKLKLLEIKTLSFDRICTNMLISTILFNKSGWKTYVRFYMLFNHGETNLKLIDLLHNLPLITYSIIRYALKSNKQAVQFQIFRYPGHLRPCANINE